MTYDLRLTPTLVAVLLFIAAGAWPASAQPLAPVEPTEHLLPQPEGDLDLQYGFEEGEEVVYRVTAVDSIVIWDHPVRTIVRERLEEVAYRCDTIMPSGLGMTMTIRRAEAREKNDTGGFRTLPTHDWVDTPIRFLMSPTGERIRLRDTLEEPGVNTGAPFQPLILPALGADRPRPVGTRVPIEREMWLTENAYPPVLFRGGALRTYDGLVPSPDGPLMSIQLSEVGHVWYTPPVLEGEIGQVTTESRINGSGTYFWSLEEGYPFAGMYDMISDLTITNDATEAKVTGRHVIYMTFERAK